MGFEIVHWISDGNGRKLCWEHLIRVASPKNEKKELYMLYNYKYMQGIFNSLHI